MTRQRRYEFDKALALKSEELAGELGPLPPMKI